MLTEWVAGLAYLRSSGGRRQEADNTNQWKGTVMLTIGRALETMVMVGLLGLAAACSSAPGAGNDDGTTATAAWKLIDSEDCLVGTVNGKVGLCHATGSTTNPYVHVRVSTKACLTGHASHVGDFVSDDPNCRPCMPTSCATAGKNCGAIADGCGGEVDCGTCVAPQTCGGAGTPNMCGEALPTHRVATTVSAGAYHTCASLSNGSIQCWGDNSHGELGNGTTASSLVPVTVSGITSASAVTASGTAHTCALLHGGSVQCWGLNSSGQLGNGTAVDSSVPVIVSGISNAISAVSTTRSSCALLADRTVRCWGYNCCGQLGDGSQTDSAVPVAVAGITDAVYLATSSGANHNCAVMGDGTAMCWGVNSVGQLGDGTNTNSLVPVTVTGITDAVAVSVSEANSCALLSNGTVQCWGDNWWGQLGNGATASSTVPVTVVNIENATAVAAGTNDACALLSSGVVQCWGGNNFGQLGDATNTNSLVPVTVLGITDAKAVATGGDDYYPRHDTSCALLNDGSVQCWGTNNIGQLGNGTTANSSIPLTVDGF
jgi:alpha-tubulin suppressor-like RCC1 family protein